MTDNYIMLIVDRNGYNGYYHCLFTCTCLHEMHVWSGCWCHDGLL